MDNKIMYKLLLNIAQIGNREREKKKSGNKERKRRTGGGRDYSPPIQSLNSFLYPHIHGSLFWAGGAHMSWKNSS